MTPTTPIEIGQDGDALIFEEAYVRRVYRALDTLGVRHLSAERFPRSAWKKSVRIVLTGDDPWADLRRVAAHPDLDIQED